MLIVTRGINDSIIIDDDIEVVVLDVKGKNVRIGIQAPPEVIVHRYEVYERVLKERKEKANGVTLGLRKD